MIYSYYMAGIGLTQIAAQCHMKRPTVQARLLRHRRQFGLSARLPQQEGDSR